MSHRNLPAVLAAVLCISASCVAAQTIVLPEERAQSNYPHIEFSGGFSYSHTEALGSSNPMGWQFTFGINPTPSLRLIGDFAHQGSVVNGLVYSGSTASIQDYQYVVGPQFVHRHYARVTPFAHTLFGVASRHYTVPASFRTGGTIVAHDFGFASIVGGGVDLNVKPRLAIRLIQADVSLEHRRWVDPQLTPAIAQLPQPSDWEVRPRLSCGIVIRLGYHPYW